VPALTVPPDGRVWAVAGTWLRCLDLANGEELSERRQRGGRKVLWSPDGRTLATDFGTVSLRAAASGKETGAINYGPTAMAFSPDSKTLVTRGYNKPTHFYSVQLWNATSGQLKATFALGRGRPVFGSHHMGDLDHPDAYQAVVQDVALYEQLFRTRPEVLAHDLHPDYASTRYAQEYAARLGVECDSRDRHHHAPSAWRD